MRRKSQEEMPGYPLQRFTDKVWWVVQMGALVAILFASIKTQVNAPVKSITGDLTQSSKEFSSHVTRGFASIKPVTITSRVVMLPSPRSEPHGQRVDLEIETRQLRFEKSWVEASYAVPGQGRSIASIASGDWLLTGIQRKSADGWEKVQLVQNHKHEALGSVFVELEEGVNEFRVIFRNKRGRESSYPVLIRHFRKRTT
jgi:hypothetical protein